MPSANGTPSDPLSEPLRTPFRTPSRSPLELRSPPSRLSLAAGCEALLPGMYAVCQRAVALGVEHVELGMMGLQILIETPSGGDLTLPSPLDPAPHVLYNTT
eukprot:142806-Prorocentrum_minimum.AAC.1